MPQFYTVLTEVGQAKLANALALGTTIDITALAVGDGGGAMPQPDSTREALVNEVRRAPVNTVATDPDNPSWLIVEQVLPPEVGGWTIREVGLIDVDGDLIGYGNFPETYKPTLAEGSGRTQTIRMVLEVTHTTAVTLRVDPSVVLATRKHVDDQRADHEAGRAHPLATDTERGMVIKASQAEVDAGEDDGKFLTAKKLKDWATNWVKAATETVTGMLKIATQTEVDAGDDDAKAVTPKKLRWGVSYSLGGSGYLALPSWMGSVIIQWGSFSSINSTNKDNWPTNQYPIAFPSGVYANVGMHSGGGATVTGLNMIIDTINNSSFTSGCSGGSSGTTYSGKFIAIGK